MYVVFTDLDGTLLDHNTYSYEAARPALEIIRSRKVPLIVCTSKTRAEIEAFRKELNISDPFISENGGAIFIPKEYFSVAFDYDRVAGEYQVIELGTTYQKLREVLKKAEAESGCKAIGFGDMSPEEVSRDTGLDLKSAKLSKLREYDEAFKLPDENCAEDLLRRIGKEGLSYTRGGRYYHIIGDNDKGRAVSILTEIFRRQHDQVITIGLGDSQNDITMLKAVDKGVLVQRPDGSYCSYEEGLWRAKGAGPVGWNSALQNILK